MEDLNKALAEASDHTADAPPRGYQVPAEGPAYFRFSAYIELGRHVNTFDPTKEVRPVAIGMELVTKKHCSQKPNGETQTHILFETPNISLDDRGLFKPLMAALNYANEKHIHMSSLLGKAYRGEVYHRNGKGRDGNVIVFANFKKAKTPWVLKPPYEIDEETNEKRIINIPPAVRKQVRFVWEPNAVISDEVYLEMWNSLDEFNRTDKEGVVSNKWRDKIKSNLDWDKSRLKRLLEEKEAGVPSLDGMMDYSEDVAF